jgi:hypothetical protein
MPFFLCRGKKISMSERVPSEQPIPRPHALVLPAAKARAKRLARAEEARLPERLREVSPNVSAFAPYEDVQGIRNAILEYADLQTDNWRHPVMRNLYEAFVHGTEAERDVATALAQARFSTPGRQMVQVAHVFPVARDRQRAAELEEARRQQQERIRRFQMEIWREEGL